jgi:hypothetical protein
MFEVWEFGIIEWKEYKIVKDAIRVVADGTNLEIY